MKQIVSSFYKYTSIENPLKLKNKLFDLCASLNIKGRILVGSEGVNGSVCGDKKDFDEFKEELKKISSFSSMEFKEQETQKNAFSRLYVSVRKEIVHLGINVDMKNTARFLTPEELKELLDKKEDIVLLDARNNYETKIGRFRNAIELNIENFRDFPKKIEVIENYKNKKIVTYCTGGIRCEKASAFLIENGFNNVWQLKGGILNFGKEFPDTYWEGKCFVFDDRIAIDLNREKNGMLAGCELCGKNGEDYINCHNLDCDKLFSCCNDCLSKWNASCSEECSIAPNRRKKNTMEIETVAY